MAYEEILDQFNSPEELKELLAAATEKYQTISTEDWNNLASQIENYCNNIGSITVVGANGVNVIIDSYSTYGQTEEGEYYSVSKIYTSESETSLIDPEDSPVAEDTDDAVDIIEEDFEEDYGDDESYTEEEEEPDVGDEIEENYGDEGLEE